MGRELFPFLSMKSKREREREQREFSHWAFPYGKEQQEKLRRLMRELFPREAPELAMMAYLTAREVYLDKYGDYADDPAFDPETEALAILAKGSVRPPRGDIPVYVALVVADAGVDERLSYPTREEVLAIAKQLQEKL